MYCQDIEARILSHIPDAQVQVDSADLQHFSALVLSPSFAGQSLLARQRQVYAALGAFIQDGTIHALQIQAHTPAEWEMRLLEQGQM